MKGKRIRIGVCSALCALAAVGGLAACGEKTGAFEPEYMIYSGGSVAISGKVTYELVNAPEGVAIDPKTGVITFDAEPYTQVLVVAKKDGKIVSETKVTLLGEFRTPTLVFENLSDNIVNGEYVEATSDTGSAVTYALKGDAEGISVERTTGKVVFSAAVKNGTRFTVAASSRGAEISREFTACTENFVSAEQTKQFVSSAALCDVGFKLDFSGDAATEALGVLGVRVGNLSAEPSLYSYDKANRLLKLNKEMFDGWSTGEHTVKLITGKNTVSVTVCVATKFISTAEELASINDSREALSGYYVLTRDIDLSEYCESRKDVGYWTPIGTYHDVTDGTALNDAFKGTFDGNGHKLTGFKIYRDEVTDTQAFNAGLFGYVDGTARIVNLGLESVAYNAARSYSGLFVGVNTGVIENCYARGDLECVGVCAGGFVGRNEGTIRNAYSVGTVVGDERIGAFAGRNMGIMENCYSVAGEKAPLLVATEEGSTTGQCFGGEDELCAYEFPFGEPWTVGEGYPYLVEAVRAYFLNGLTLAGAPAEMYKGTTVVLYAVLSPADAAETPVFSSSVGSVENGVLTVPLSETASECVVTVTCGDFSDSVTISLLDPKLEILNEETGIAKSYSVDLKVAVYPETEEYLSAVRYEVVGGTSGVTVDENGRVTVSRNCKAASCTVRVYIEGVAEAFVSFEIYEPGS